MKKNVNIALNQVAVLGLLVKIEWFHISLQAIGPATCLQQPSNLQALQLCFKLKKKVSVRLFCKAFVGNIRQSRQPIKLDNL